MLHLKSPKLLCGLIVVYGALAYVDSLLPQTQAANSNEKRNVRSGIEFWRGNSGDLITPTGISLGFTNYRSSDGVNLRVLYQNFGNLDQATEAFDKEIAGAAKIVKRAPKLDVKAKVVGDRAEVVLQPSAEQQTLFAVMWTDGAKYHEIRSRSLRHILELEKDYKY